MNYKEKYKKYIKKIKSLNKKKICNSYNCSLFKKKMIFTDNIKN